MLFMICNAIMGKYYCEDYPGVIEPQIKTVLNIGHKKFGLLYSLSFLPNCIVPIFAGILMEKIGVNKTILICSATITFGQIIFSTGGYLNNFEVMLAGRFVYGFFLMSYEAVLQKILFDWFGGGKYLSLAGNILVCIIRLSSVAVGHSVPYVTD